MDVSLFLDEFIEAKYEEDLKEQFDYDMVEIIKESESRGAEYDRANETISALMYHNFVNSDLSLKDKVLSEKFNVFMSELLRISSEYSNTTSVPESEIKQLIEKSTLIDKENERINGKINRLKEIKALIFDCLNIRLETEKQNIYKITFLNECLSQSEIQVLVQWKEKTNTYNVLEYRGIDKDTFDRMNHQLLKTEDFTMFLVNIRNHLIQNKEE